MFLGSIVAVVLVSSALAAWGAELQVTGTWTRTIGQADLVAGAGTDIRSSIESDASQVTINISQTDGMP